MEDLILLTPINNNKHLGIAHDNSYSIYITKIYISGSSENFENIKIWNGDELIINEAFSEKEYIFEPKLVKSPGLYFQLEQGFGYCEVWGYYNLDN